MSNKKQNQHCFFKPSDLPKEEAPKVLPSQELVTIRFKNRKISVPFKGDMRIEFSDALREEKEIDNSNDNAKTVVRPLLTTCKVEAGKIGIDHTDDHDKPSPQISLASLAR